MFFTCSAVATPNKTGGSRLQNLSSLSLFRRCSMQHRLVWAMTFHKCLIFCLLYLWLLPICPSFSQSIKFFPFTPWPAQWLFSRRIYHQTSICNLVSSKHSTCPSHRSLLGFTNLTVLADLCNSPHS